MLFTTLLLAMSAVPGATDTLVVNKALLEGPYAVVKPYATDSVNMQGEAYGMQDVLEANESLVYAPRKQKEALSLTAHAPLAATENGESALRVLRFSVQTPRFVKGKVKVQHLENYKLYVNRIESPGKSFELAPGRTEFEILAVTRPESKDTFDVKLIGEGLSACVVNPEGKRPYTMADMLLGNQYRSVALSPSGKYLVTTSYFMKADGTAPYTTTITEMATGRELMHRGDYMSLRWVKGAAKDLLYFTRSGSQGRELVFLDPSNLSERIVAQGIPEGSITLSPKQDYFIYSQGEEPYKEKLAGLKRLEQPDDRQPGWRNRSSLWRYDLNTGVSQRLSFGKESVWLNDISSDGKRLLVSKSSFDAKKLPFERTTLMCMDAYTGRTDTLVNDTIFLAGATFSPDASKLLVKASPLAFNGVGNEVKDGQTPNSFDYRLYLYDIATRKVSPLLPHFAPSVDDYEWSKRDGFIYFSADDGCNKSLFRLDPKSLKRVRYELPVSYVQDFTIATGTPNPSAVFFGQTGERAREMFATTLTAKANTPSRRIGPNNFDEMYADVKVGHCQDWAFKATRGDSIHGFYFLPPDFDASKKYPMIVYYYGGCTPTGKTLQFQYPLQVLAGQGYVVYVCEPSGAIGYGQEFAARHVNTWGKESGDDIIEGTKKFLAEHPYVDAKRVGCMGASYGGFMTEYLQTQTDIFAAAVSHAGISNIASYWGGGYWGYTYGECAQYGSYPWNNPDLYVKQSPLFNADKIHTPLLLLHGTADTNVPTNESQQLFTALKILGRDVSYIQVDGENHVIVDFKKRLAWQNAIFAWFAKYLQGDDTWWNTLYPKR